MAREIPEQVAQNRQDVKRIDGEFITVPSSVQRDLAFSRNAVNLTPEATTYTRPLNDSVVSGHPNGDQHGSGQGVSGDQRGAWSAAQSIPSANCAFTRGGRSAVARALDGQQSGSVGGSAVGTGRTTAEVENTALEAQAGETWAYGLKDAPETVRTRSQYRFSELGPGGWPDIYEVALEAANGDLMARCVADTATSTGPESELRADVSLTVSGSGATSSVFTAAGEQAVADSIQVEGVTNGIAEIAWGTGTQTLTDATTSLDTEVFRKNAGRSVGTERVTASAPQFQSEPAGQPFTYTEVGVFDTAGNLMWVVVFDGYGKDEDTRFTTSVGFGIQ